MGTNSDDNSTTSQRSRILRHLEENGSITTLQARHLLDIMHPAQRCLELKEAGHRIVCIWTKDVTPEGFSHRVGKYILLPRKQLTLDDFLPGKKEHIS
ncbi:MAG: hypothetical protein ACD_35C00111G0002 [uncultured bacterium]|nr:MAG: hypothetical protein ACD_35C00111G0002 [uncultured bacterium]